MKTATWLLAAILGFLLSALPAQAQVSASITGTATFDGAVLPGVAVTISSVAMQGTRSTATDVNGRYSFIAIPPGEYTVRFELSGMQTASTTIRAGVGQTARADAAMREGDEESPAPAEATSATIETKSVQTSLTREAIDLLPVGRDPVSYVDLAPGTNGRAISGASERASAWLMDGGSLAEYFTRAPVPLYVEDAIQETTLLTAGVPAEYGRFNGGVVNSITRSGGNVWSGSFRDSFTNPSWTEPSPYQNIENVDETDQTFEAALGGRILHDQLWFFAAGRQFSDTNQKFYALSPSYGFTSKVDDRRWQAKLTGQVSTGHSIVASWFDAPWSDENYCFANICAEPSTVDPDRSIGKRLATARYVGMFGSRLAAEAYWSEMNIRFEDSGGDATDPANGTWGQDALRAPYPIFGAPVFCGTCDPEQREGTTYGVKATWYLPTSSLGTHSFSAGYENWASEQVGNNFQSGSNYGIYTYSHQSYDLKPGDTFRPTIARGDIIAWFPVPVLDKPSDHQIHSAFVSDKWDLGPRFSFNIGIRYDLNDIIDETGYVVSDADVVQPRLAATWDVYGDGKYRVNASYGRYADLLTNGVGSAAWQGGNPLLLYWEYTGPVISGLPTPEAFVRLFDWFFAQCDSQGHCGNENMETLLFARGTGFGVKFGESLESAVVDEASLGFSIARGANAYLRADAVFRDWSNFLVNRVTVETGQTADPFGNPIDWQVLENDDSGLKRRYTALMIQGALRIGRNWSIGGNYTWSELEANVNPNGMNIANGASYYPELAGFPQRNPVGSDERHKLRAYAAYTLPTSFGRFDFSVLESFDSGTPYSIAGGISTNFDLAARRAYASEGRTVGYFFSDRDAFHWDDVTSTDIGVRYEFPLLRTEGVFVDFTVANLFDEASQTGGDASVWTAAPGTADLCRQAADPSKPCAIFNPFTETPVKGVHYVLSPTFGEPVSTTHYQTPRTYSFSAGIRF